MNNDLRANIGRLPFNYSTYVALAICYALDWWMDPANAGTKADLLQQFPFLVKLGGPVSFALWLASRTWPQAGSSVAPAAAPAPAIELQDTVPMPVARLTVEETQAILKAAEIIKVRQ